MISTSKETGRLEVEEENVLFASANEKHMSDGVEIDGGRFDLCAEDGTE